LFPSQHPTLPNLHIYKLNNLICLVKEDLVVAVADPAHLSHLLGQLQHSSKVDPPQHLHILQRTQRLVLLQLQHRLKVRAKAPVFSARWPVLLRKSAGMRRYKNTVDTFIIEV
jgi:hypothetical protein